MLLFICFMDLGSFCRWLISVFWTKNKVIVCFCSCLNTVLTNSASDSLELTSYYKFKLVGMSETVTESLRRNRFTLKLGKILDFEWLSSVWACWLTYLLKLTYQSRIFGRFDTKKWNTASRGFKENVQILRNVLVFSHNFRWVYVHLSQRTPNNHCLYHCQYLFNNSLVGSKPVIFVFGKLCHSSAMS